MIIKKEGVINDIIYNNTVYHNGEYRIYPTLSQLKNLIKEIIQSKATTECIRVTPFYNNAKLNQQIEFDEYMFYMECREHVDDKSVENHIGLCIDKKYVDMNYEEIRLGKILFPLCKNKDTETYKKSLEVYVEFLYELIPRLMEISKSKMELKDEDLAFGYFCFEVQSE
ncbi:hypothetical protein AWN73_20240 [Clostridium butyricum]|uniref:Uncharacterized protein n=1 Tax=Clostridium butyricum TaxID=1492 RepID=A0A2S7F4Z6_CLOBU|nr:hypothetical protein [Clostridium butyricum]PPV11890.1 hypothetical protein AWN73_20240 [Clostridium butyricum]